MFPHGGRGTETTVLLEDTLSCYWRTWRGDHCPTKICCFVITTPNVKRGWVFKSRTGVSVPRPPAAKIYPPIPKLCFLMEDGARRPSSYFKIPFLVAGGRGTETTVLLEDTFSCCWRTWHGGHRPTLGGIRKRPRTFALGRFIGSQSVVSVCCFSLLFPVCFLHFLFYCSV